MSGLEQERDHLLRSLEDLECERDAGDLDEADYRTLTDDYTARAAAVLRALAAEPGPADRSGGENLRNPEADAAQAADPARIGPADRSGGENLRNPEADAAQTAVSPPGAAPARPGDVARAADGRTGPQARRREREGAAPPPSGSGGRRRPVLVLAALVAFASGAGVVVARSAGQRLAGDPATGEIAATGPAAAVARDLAEARGLIGEGRTLDAIKVYDRVLDHDAGQPEALAYRGWLLRLAGRAAADPALIDKGMEYIERAVAADPGYPDARFFRAFVNYQDRRDPAAAVPDLRAFLAADAPPEMVATVEDLLRRALAEVQAGAPAPVPAPAPAPSPPAG